MAAQGELPAGREGGGVGAKATGTGATDPAMSDAAAETPTWQTRLAREIRNPRPATLIGFALAVMIAAALWTAGRSANEPGPDREPAPAAAEMPGATTP